MALRSVRSALLATALLFCAASAEDFLGCGGFVRLSDPVRAVVGDNADLSAVSVRISKAGVAKFETECSPAGYFFLPVYERGTYTVAITRPAGWSYEPAEATVTVGEGEKQCTGNVDVTFTVTGFTVTGKVAADASCAAEPSDVKVAMSDLASGMSAGSVTKGGVFEFTDVLPGTYGLKATKPGWTILSAVPAEGIELNKAKNHDLGVAFRVAGYEVSGTVTDGRDGVSGVTIGLFVRSGVAVTRSCPSTPRGEAPKLEGFDYVCGATTGADGAFVLTGVSCGEYTLVPFYRSDTTEFDVSPNRASVTVKGDAVALGRAFQVTGFSASGHVAGPDGHGVAGAAVLINGKQAATADKNGNYRLEKLSAGTVEVRATAPHTHFEPLKGVRLSAASPRVPTISVSAFDICGKVAVERVPKGVTPYPRVVVLKSATAAERRIRTDSKGEFCEKVAPGEYTLEAEVTEKEAHAGLRLFPAQLPVDARKAPVMGLSFAQETFRLSGSIRALAPIAEEVVVFVEPAAAGAPGSRAETRVSCGKMVCEYAFAGVLPADYVVRAERSGWVFAQPSHRVSVVASAESVPEIAQSGYVALLEVSHKAVVTFASPAASAPIVVNAPAGESTRVILTVPGEYDVTAESCAQFAPAKYDTAKGAKTLSLRAKSFLVSGVVRVSDAAAASAVSVAAKPAVEVKTVVSGTEIKYSAFLEQGQTVVFTPSATSGDLLFYPATVTANVKSFECPGPLPETRGRPGLFVRGAIKPALAGVSVVVKDRSTGAKMGQTTSAADGSYSVGPLYDDHKYETSFELSGFSFEQKADGSVRAMELGRVAARVVDASGAVMPGVLMSISGGRAGAAFHSNSLSNADGRVSIVGLAPGQYFIRPLLKEYVFSPASQSVSVAEGSEALATFKAERTAFSIYGSVRTLDGMPLSGVDAKAVPAEGLAAGQEPEIAQTDATGNFRIRGLAPGKTYHLTVSGSVVGHTAPTVHRVVVGAADVRDVGFVVFSSGTFRAVSGTVNVTSDDEKLRESIEVVLSAPGEQTRRIPLGVSSFFEFTGVSAARYTVRVVSTLPQMSPNCHASPESMMADVTQKDTARLAFTFSCGQRHDVTEGTKTSPLSLIVGIAVVVAVFMRERIVELVTELVAQQMNGKSKSQARAAHDDDDSFLPTHLRKQQARKTK